MRTGSARRRWPGNSAPARRLPTRGGTRRGRRGRQDARGRFGCSFVERLLDVPLLKAMGKTVVFHFHGCEVRRRATMLERHRLSTCTECDPFCRPRRQAWLAGRTARLADHVFYSTLDL